MCKFCFDPIDFLGYIVSKDGIMVDPSKIEAVITWVRLTNMNDVRTFLGLVNGTIGQR